MCPVVSRIATNEQQNEGNCSGMKEVPGFINYSLACFLALDWGGVGLDGRSGRAAAGGTGFGAA